MKYRKEIYEKALASLAELRETMKEDETPALDFIAEAVAEKGDRDVVWCAYCEGHHPIHERQPLKVFISDDGMLSVEAYRRSKGKKDWVSYQSRIRYCPYCGREIPIDEKPES